MHTNAWLGADHFTIVSPLNFENPYYSIGHFFTCPTGQRQIRPNDTFTPNCNAVGLKAWIGMAPIS